MAQRLDRGGLVAMSFPSRQKASRYRGGPRVDRCARCGRRPDQVWFGHNPLDGRDWWSMFEFVTLCPDCVARLWRRAPEKADWGDYEQVWAMLLRDAGLLDDRQRRPPGKPTMLD